MLTPTGSELDLALVRCQNVAFLIDGQTQQIALNACKFIVMAGAMCGKSTRISDLVLQEKYVGQIWQQARRMPGESLFCHDMQNKWEAADGA